MSECITHSPRQSGLSWGGLLGVGVAQSLEESQALQDGVSREVRSGGIAEGGRGPMRGGRRGVSSHAWRPGAWSWRGEAGLGTSSLLMSDPQQDWETAMKHVALAP